MLPEQIQKIRSDLTITQTNMAILSDMLTELSPGREHPEDRSLLQQLHGTCRAMQSRLVELIDQVDDDKLTADLLEVNDNMNNIFLRWEKLKTFLSAVSTPDKILCHYFSVSTSTLHCQYSGMKDTRRTKYKPSTEPSGRVPLSPCLWTAKGLRVIVVSPSLWWTLL